MGSQARKLLEAALALPKAERAELAAQIRASVDADGSPSDRTALHRELEASIADTSGKLTDADEVITELRAMR